MWISVLKTAVAVSVCLLLWVDQSVARPAIQGWAGAGGIYSTPQKAAAATCSATPGFAGVGDVLSADATSAIVQCKWFSGYEPPNDITITSQPYGYVWHCNPGWVADPVTKTCTRNTASDPDKPNHCPKVGNPINPLTGIKTEREVDFSTGVGKPLKFERVYSSHPGLRNASGVLGKVWQTTFDTRVVAGGFQQDPHAGYISCGRAAGGIGDYVNEVDSSGLMVWRNVSECVDPVGVPPVSGIDYAYVDHVGGFSTYFEFDATSMTPLVGLAEGDVTSTLEMLLDPVGELDGWKYITSDNDAYTYSGEGKLIDISFRNGSQLTLDYDLTLANGGDGNPLTLDQVTDNENRSLSFSYTLVGGKPRLHTFEDPDGNIFSYTYNGNDLLETVTYPDISGTLPIRTYLYEKSEPELFWALTGIVDERNTRYATWEYDSYGRAFSSERGSTGSGWDKVVIDYSNSASAGLSSITVTNALGQESVYHSRLVQGVRKLYRVERLSHTNVDDQAVGCAAADQYTSYDANGFKDIAVDWEGNAIDYDHDSEGREIRREEGLAATVVDISGSLPSITLAQVAGVTRVITTKWHPNFRLRTRITEPDKVVDMFYNCDSGRLESRKEWTPATAPDYSAIAPVCP